MQTNGIRLGRKEDHPHIVRMVHSFIDSAEFPSTFSKSAQKIDELVSSFLEGNPYKLLLVVTNDFDMPVGMLAAFIQEGLFSEDRMATELCWWVDPEARGRKSLKLLEGYEYWARVLGCKVSMLSNFHGNFESGTDRVYLRRGYNPVETAWVKVL